MESYSFIKMFTCFYIYFFINLHLHLFIYVPSIHSPPPSPLCPSMCRPHNLHHSSYLLIHFLLFNPYLTLFSLLPSFLPCFLPSFLPFLYRWFFIFSVTSLHFSLSRVSTSNSDSASPALSTPGMPYTVYRLWVKNWVSTPQSKSYWTAIFLYWLFHELSFLGLI